jgi:hypothetical protein
MLDDARQPYRHLRTAVHHEEGIAGCVVEVRRLAATILEVTISTALLEPFVRATVFRPLALMSRRPVS